MILNEEGLSKILEIISAKTDTFEFLAPQEIQRITEVIKSQIEVLNQSMDPIKNKSQWLTTAKNRIQEQLNVISNFLGTKEFGNQLDVSALVNMIYEVEYETDKFLKQDI